MPTRQNLLATLPSEVTGMLLTTAALSPRRLGRSVTPAADLPQNPVLREHHD